MQSNDSNQLYEEENLQRYHMLLVEFEFYSFLKLLYFFLIY